MFAVRLHALMQWKGNLTLSNLANTSVLSKVMHVNSVFITLELTSYMMTICIGTSSSNAIEKESIFE